MLAIDIDGDWVEAIIVVIVLVGSALSALAKAITNKMRKQQMPDLLEPESESSEPEPARRTRPIPPVARPLSQPIERRVIVRTQRPISSQDEKRADYEFEVALPEAVRPLVEMLLDKTVGDAEERPRPAPPPPPPRVSRPRPQRPRSQRRQLEKPSAPAITEREARLRDIAEREERRIGHVETHVAPTTTEELQAQPGVAGLLDRRSLRRAIILSEVLGPPLALRGDS